MSTPREELNRLIAGFWTTQAIYVAVRLRVPDLLANGPRTADDLARESGAHPRSLYRLLRALASSGVFHEDAEHRFALTPMSECLRRDTPASMAALSWMRGDWQYRAWGDLLHNVQTGETAFDHLFGESLFEFLAGGTACFKLCAQHRKHEVDGQPRVASTFWIRRSFKVSDAFGTQVFQTCATQTRSHQLQIFNVCQN